MNRTSRLFLTLGAVSGAIAVIAGAFGAHAVADMVSPDRLATFKTGSQYQLVHAVMLCLVGILANRVSSKALRWSGWLFAVGTVLFSGSLYALVAADTPGLGIITPFGGLVFICGWLLLFVAVWKAEGSQLN